MKAVFLLLCILTTSFSNFSHARSATYPQCSAGKGTSGFAEVKKMAHDILGLDIGSQSLVEQKKDRNRAQYWLLNSGGVASLRMKASIDVSAKATICQLDAHSIRLVGCGSYFGISKCYTSTMAKTGSGSYHLTYKGHSDWDRDYSSATAAEIAR